MTLEDEKMIVGYMEKAGWFWNNIEDCFCRVDLFQRIIVPVYFDLNDAGLVVAEMQKRGEWMTFRKFQMNMIWKPELKEDSVAWLMTMEDGQAKNFFKAFTEWRKRNENIRII